MSVYVCLCPPLNLQSFIINKCSIVNVEMINQEEKKSIFQGGVCFCFFMTYLPCEFCCACLESRVRSVNSSDELPVRLHMHRPFINKHL